MGLLGRLSHAWNAFVDSNPFRGTTSYSGGGGYGSRPDRPRLQYSNEKSIISSIYTRISIDVSGVDIRHVRLDEDERYLETISSGLNDCLTFEANIDQAGRQFRQDMALTMMDSGTCAIVPVDTSLNPEFTGSFDIKTMRVGRIIAWHPRHVTVSLYNDRKGVQEQITLEKKICGIVENPFYAVMNEPNSTLQRLIRKLNLLDAVDEQSSSGKLDIIIQLPYVVKSDSKRAQAEQRRKDIDVQLNGSKYGVAYTDGTEKITQLNRPAENNLLVQVQYLTDMLYSQLGLTPEVMNGTADEKTMLNYNNRTVKPILDALVEAMRRAFLTKTARSQKQSIMYFRDPFSLVPLTEMADIADKLSRNEILTPNEIRSAMGIRPHKDPNADKLHNSNMPDPVAPADQSPAPSGPDSPPQQEEGGDSQNGS